MNKANELEFEKIFKETIEVKRFIDSVPIKNTFELLYEAQDEQG